MLGLIDHREDAFLFGDHRLHRVALRGLRGDALRAARSRARRPCRRPAQSAPAGHRPHRPGSARRPARRGPRGCTRSCRSARRRARAAPPAYRALARAVFPRRARRGVRGAVNLQPARIGAPLRCELSPRDRFRLFRTRRFLRGRELLRARLPVNNKVARAPSPAADWSAATTPALQRLVMPAISPIPERSSTTHSAPISAHSSCTHDSLVDDAGRAGLVIQRFRVDRHQRAVRAGLAIGHQDVGVQVRVPAPRRFMLVGDPHQTRQALQILVCR